MPFQIHLIIGGICSRDVHDSLAESHDTRVHRECGSADVCTLRIVHVVRSAWSVTIARLPGSSRTPATCVKDSWSVASGFPVRSYFDWAGIAIGEINSVAKSSRIDGS